MCKNINRYIVSCDDTVYSAFPDVAMSPDGRMVCVFADCKYHTDRSYNCIKYTISDDRGKTWSPKASLTKPQNINPAKDFFWNCPRISYLSDGKFVMITDSVRMPDGDHTDNLWLSISKDGTGWSEMTRTAIAGMVPDKIIELKHPLHKGRLMCSTTLIVNGLWNVYSWFSDDRGLNWSGPFVIACKPELKLCEPSIVEMPSGELVCFMRENSFKGLDAFKAVSKDGGVSWQGLCGFPIPGCHRPVAGMLNSGNVMITCRLMQGGDQSFGWGMQNTLAVLTDVQSCLADERNKSHCRILPLDYDRAKRADTGYTGWVQFQDGMLYVVNYIIDDKPQSHIRGYCFKENEFLIN